MISQYEHAYAAVKPHGDNGWRTDAELRGQSEGLMWVVRTREGAERLNRDDSVYARMSESGVYLTPHEQSAEEYVLADRVDIKPNGSLVFELGTPMHIVSVKAYAHGQWIGFHLLSDPHEIARRTATFLKDDES